MLNIKFDKSNIRTQFGPTGIPRSAMRVGTLNIKQLWSKVVRWTIQQSAPLLEWLKATIQSTQVEMFFYLFCVVQASRCSVHSHRITADK